MKVPSTLRGRIHPPLSLAEIQKRIAFDRALRPAKRHVSEDEFEQAVYDAIARDTTLSRAAAVRWARRTLEVIPPNGINRVPELPAKSKRTKGETVSISEKGRRVRGLL